MDATITVLAGLLIIAARLAWFRAGRIVELRKEVEYQKSRCDDWIALAEKTGHKLDRAQAEIRALEDKLQEVTK